MSRLTGWLVAVALLAGCSTTRFEPTEPQPATWQSAQETVRLLLEATPRIENVRVTDEGFVYTHLVRHRYMERRGRPRRVRKALYFADMARVAVQRTTSPMSDPFWQVALTLRDDSRLLLPPQTAAKDAKELAAALARLGTFLPDPTLEEPDLPPVFLDQHAPPGIPEDQLDRELELALRRAPAGPRGARTSSLLWSGRQDEEEEPEPEPEPEPIRLTLRFACQYVVPEDVEAEGGVLALNMEIDGPDDKTEGLSATVAVDCTERIRLEAGFRAIKLSGAATSTSSTISMWAGAPERYVLQSWGDVEIVSGDLDVSWSFRPLSWLTVSPRLGGRYVSVDAEYMTLPPLGVYGFGLPLYVDLKIGAPMLAVSVEVRPGGDSPFAVAATMRGGGMKASDKDLRFLEARLEVSYLWEETVGLAVGYRLDYLKFFEEGENAIFSPTDAGVRALLHGPYVAAVVSF